jgi:hypothetical protein
MAPSLNTYIPVLDCAYAQNVHGLQWVVSIGMTTPLQCSFATSSFNDLDSLFNCAYESLRGLDLQNWRFLRQTNKQTELIALSLVHVCR